MTTAEEFETVDAATVKKLTTTARSKEIDMTWAGRIRTLGIGQGFKTTRPETETVRQFKRRINAAAEYSFRSLTWTTLDPKQPEGIEPSKFLAKVQAIDTKAQEEAANKPPETSESTESALGSASANGPVETSENPPAEETASVRRPRAS
jgi:hypothetical protein